MSGKAKESMECMRKFGPAGRLYPYLGKEVRTPKGAGILLSVMGGVAQVQLYRTRPVRMYPGRKPVRPATDIPAEEVMTR